ncbi:MAG TPA: beta-ketoacyl-ACP synthase [Verrucomicrobiae bacterium]|nr:beta-ketoacyl-ACP synthase [Verrucomicrobiae bacterium]
MKRDVWITGCGLISALGEGRAANWATLNDPAAWPARMDSQKLAPHTIHPMVPLELGRYIPRPGDQRAMGPLMHYGCYAAGMALAEAGVAGNQELLARTHMIVAAPGGERDLAVDEQILAARLTKPNNVGWLNEMMLTGLRPTLFLAQLPNLFAGNISIVHGVSGSSRTFMGEESAGVDAVRIAWEKIAAGQGDLFLVGGAFSADRPEMLLMFEPYGLLRQTPVPDLWHRPRAGMTLGSVGAFLVMEAPEHAEARGIKPLARLSAVRAAHSNRAAGAATAKAAEQWAGIADLAGGKAPPVLSGACGGAPITAEEHEFLAGLPGAPSVRGTAGALGHSMEASFLANLGLAITSLEQGRLFGPLAPEEPIETRGGDDAEKILVTSWGHYRGEALAMIERIV